MSINKNDFIKLNNKKFILKEWSHNYKNQMPKKFINVKKSYNDFDIMQHIIEIYKAHKINKLSSSIIREELEKIDMTFKDSTYRSKLSSYPILEKSGKNYSREIILKNDYETILSSRNFYKEKKLKKDVIKKEVNNILEKNNNLMLQSKLVKILENRFSFPRGTVYNIFQTDSSYKRQYDNQKTYITMYNEDSKKNNSDNEISQIINSVESDILEFKSSFRWDMEENRVNKDLEYEVLKTIAAFLNSNGGSLLIGADDNNKLLGLNYDFNTFPKKNTDGFQLHLVNVIKKHINKDKLRFIKIEFHNCGVETICWVKVEKSDTPIYIKRNSETIFLIRGSGLSQKLDIDEVFNYVKGHWKETIQYPRS